MKKAKKLQKQAERKDYYKILNVKRTATKQEIIKAYRLVIINNKLSLKLTLPYNIFNF